LIKQRLKKMVVLPIYYRDLGMRMSEGLAEGQSAKSGPTTT